MMLAALDRRSRKAARGPAADRALSDKFLRSATSATRRRPTGETPLSLT